MGRDALGDLEHQAMLALLHLGDESYTAPVVEELERRTGRGTTVASVYVVLRRLEKKGYVVSQLRGPGAEGGRDRRCFIVTPSGMARLRQEQAAYQSLWAGLDLSKGGPS